jgi:hypothetical protein
MDEEPSQEESEESEESEEEDLTVAQFCTALEGLVSTSEVHHLHRGHSSPLQPLAHPPLTQIQHNESQTLCPHASALLPL